MTPNPYQPPANPQPQKSNNKLLIGLLIGCGCLPLGIFVLGILAAISLPSFLNQVSRARTSEATSNIGAVLRGQQVYFLENKRFATSITDLDTRLTARYFTYQVIPQTVPNRGSSSDPKAVVAGSAVIATPQQPELKSVLGVIFTDKEGNVIMQTCASDTPGTEPPPIPQAPTTVTIGAEIPCPPGTTIVK
jgi:type II secretory pathway pseudopilin PulG